MSLRLAVIGKTGQLARALLREGEDMGHEIIALDREALDLASNPQTIESAIEMRPSRHPACAYFHGLRFRR